jgi:hypothetical protein
MTGNKTNITGVRVADYLSTIDDDERRQDCETLIKLMASITHTQPNIWGSSIIGFGCYHYRYPSGREGDAALTGFASRRTDISVYLVASAANQDQLLAQLGRHKMGKACLYIRKLADIDMHVLTQLIAGSVSEVKRRYG